MSRREDRPGTLCTEGISCRHTPCKSKFCQRCGNHGHAAETCRMPDDTSSVNLQGYFQDEKGEGATPISRSARHEFGPPAECQEQCSATQRQRGRASASRPESQGPGRWKPQTDASSVTRAKGEAGHRLPTRECWRRALPHTLGHRLLP